MKAAAFLAGLVLTAACLRAEEPPAVKIEQALALAQAHLKAGGYDKEHWISSVVLERESMMRPSYHWFVKWEPAIALDGRRELGLQVNMDGSIARTVDKKASK